MTKKQHAIIDFIEYQLNILIKSEIKESKKRNYIFLNTENIPSEKIRIIQSLGIEKNKYSVENNGYKCIALKF
jgi:hypothetical protein